MALARASKAFSLRPGLRSGAGNSERAAADTVPSFAAKLDTTLFAADKLNIDAYLRSILPNSTEEGVREQFKQLSITREQASAALQQNVHSNHNEFIRTSRDIAQLELDLASLQQLFADFKSVGQDMMEAAPDEKQREENSAEEQSNRALSEAPKVLDVAVLERRQADMNTIKAAVDGAQLYLETNDRYLLREDDMVELNSETYQPLQVVHIYTFNDGLLVAVPRKGKAKTKSRSTMSSAMLGKSMVAEQFVHFQDLAVINMKDTEGVRNAVKLMKYPDSYLYKAASKDDKQRWLNVLKAATDDFLKENSAKPMPTPAISATKEPKGHRRTISIGKSILSLRPNKPQEKEEVIVTSPDEPLGNAVNLASLGMAPAELTSEQWQWIEEEFDELDVYLAQRQFDQAVQHVNEMRSFFTKFPEHAQNLRDMRQGLEMRVTVLANRLAADLSSASLLSQTHLRSHIKLMLNLGLSQQAREIYLNSRSTTLKDRVRKLKFEGDITSYIQRLSFLVFSFLSDSGEYYRASFKEGHLSSAFVLWATEQLNDYAAIFRRYVFHHHSFRIVVDCLRIAAEHCIELRNAGYDFLFFIEKSFHNDICTAIEAYQKRTEAMISKSVTGDRWVSVKDKVKTLQDGIKASFVLTSSLVDFEGAFYEFLDDVEDIYSVNLYNPIISFVTSVFDKFVRMVVDISNTKMLRDSQFLSIVMDVVYVVTILLPEVTLTLKTRLDRDVMEIDKLQRKLDAMESALVTAYAKRRSEELSAMLITAVENGYSSAASKKKRGRESELPQTVSLTTAKIIGSLRAMSVDLNFVTMRTLIMTTLIQQLAVTLSEASFDRGRFKLTAWVVHQLILDLNVLAFILAVPMFGSPLVGKSLKTAIEHVAEAYTQPKSSSKRRNNRRRDEDDEDEVESPDLSLESEQWFLTKAKAAVVSLQDGMSLEEFWTTYPDEDSVLTPDK